MRSLVVALQLMTRLPLPQVQAGTAEFAAAIRWFPAAGFPIGGAVAAALALGMRFDPWAAAMLALLIWVALTGALHLDGLGDVADAVGAAHGDSTRMSTVLADPHIGSFGVTAIVMQLLGKLVLLRLTAGTVSPWSIIAITVLARIGPLAWTLLLPPLHQGLASRFREGAGLRHLLAWSPVMAAACLLQPALLVGLPLVLAWAWWLRTRMGGVSGDGHGAGIELVESGLLVALVLGR